MAKRRKEAEQLADDPLWYKDAIIYQLHVRAFSDSDADGIGDFRGLTEKLPYLADLGVTAVWLLPFYPSPLRDDGYDIAEYTDVNPSYGSLDDFETFMQEAHRLGLRVITELVINHTSDQHPWFQRSRAAKPGTKWHDFYVWSDSPDRYQDTRIIFKDFETSNWAWDPVARAYYWHRFYSHQPDLNFENPEVQKAVLKALDFWMDRGVDGLRLDAIPYLYEREGTNCENLPETHAYLKQLRAHVDRRYHNKMLLAEANQWPEDSRPYFGDGDECHMAFHFPLMPRLFMSVAMEDRFPIIDIMQQTPDIPETAQWAVFLRNHDELTLEMVTDEDRDFMWRMYAADRQARINLGIRRRLAPLLGNHRRRVELLNGPLFSAAGTPIIYYGDEIGMGDNIYLGDRNGVRTPMQWSSDRNAGFSRANPQRLYFPVIIDPEYHFESVNVEAQQNNPSSLLWWMKRIIALRKQFKAFGRGSLEFLLPENNKVLAFFRRYEEEVILVVANLSRFVQFAELDLSRFRGMTPVELFGRTRFPTVGQAPFPITLGPHDFFWFSLEPQRTAEIAAVPEPPLIQAHTWKDLLRGQNRSVLAHSLARWIQTRRWFASKSREMKGGVIEDAVMVGGNDAIVLYRVDYAEGNPDTYAIPLTIASRLAEPASEAGQAAVARLRGTRGEEAVLFEAIWNREFCDLLLAAVGRKRIFRGDRGEIRGFQTRIYRELLREAREPMDATAPRTEQSNTSIRYGQTLLLKLFRKVEPGINPDLEISRFLTEETKFRHFAPLAGALEYQRGKNEPATVGIVTRFIPSGGDAWKYSLDAIGRYYERVLSKPEIVGSLAKATPKEPPHLLVKKPFPEIVGRFLGGYLPHAELLGQRSAEMHHALGSSRDNPAFV
ncbi:MAG TPA: maltose alpha-D-glucosyltransferase, partial [Thermoanaerobaculia bacterium]|nr:maltose alpha-D-glucosyltransferase [Thermoanaerobaculia bacterium]